MVSIYCDMDQVLVNFLGGARRALGMEFNDPRLGSDKDKWFIIAQMPGFWRSLHWMPQAPLLWERIKDKNTYILSACPLPEEAPLCPTEKKLWCADNLNLHENRVHTVKRAEKARYAQTNGIPNLLIDDHPRNVSEWEAAGGIAILHHTIPETLSELESRGF